MGGSSSGLSPRSLWRNILLGSSIATCASRNKIAKHTKQFKQKLKEGQHILIKHIQNNLNKNQKKTQQILIKHILYTIAIRVPNTIIAEFWLFHLTTDLCFNDRSWVSYPNFFFFFNVSSSPPMPEPCVVKHLKQCLGGYSLEYNLIDVSTSNSLNGIVAVIYSPCILRIRCPFHRDPHVFVVFVVVSYRRFFF